MNLNRLDQLSESVIILHELLPKYKYIIDIVMAFDFNRVKTLENHMFKAKVAIESLITALDTTFTTLKYPAAEFLSETFKNRLDKLNKDVQYCVDYGRILLKLEDDLFLVEPEDFYHYDSVHE